MSQLETALRDALAQTLETMAFTEVEPGARPAQEPAGACHATLAVLKPLQGRLRIELGEALLVSIASNIYGEDLSENSGGALLDSLGEIANIVLGALVAGLIADDATVPAKQLQLALPATGRGPCPHPAPGKAFYYLVDGNPLRITLEGADLLRYDR